MNAVFFRFYEELNDQLPEEKRKVWFEYSFEGTMSLQEVFQYLEVTEDEIDLVLVNQQSVGLDYVLQDGDRISVYPVFELFDISGIRKLKGEPLRDLKFVCDVHLGRLCKYLRMFGWDTVYSNLFSPADLIKISVQENRLLLTRNYELSRNKKLTHAYWVRSSDPLEQIRELILKLDLAKMSHPLTRCLNCNQMIVPVAKELIVHRLQPRTEKYFNEFFLCPDCGQIYWKGSHYEHMLEFIQKAEIA